MFLSLIGKFPILVNDQVPLTGNDWQCSLCEFDCFQELFGYLKYSLLVFRNILISTGLEFRNILVFSSPVKWKYLGRYKVRLK